MPEGGAGDWTTKYNPFGAGSTFKSGWERVPEEAPPLKYSPPEPFMKGHRCTDPICGLIFFICIGFCGYVLTYAIQNGDPRKVYHGLDYEGNLCGVDLPFQPYVYWCQDVEGRFADASATVAGLDFHHPICVASCPISSSTQSKCFNPETGQSELTADYATHPVAHRYCFPQSTNLLKLYNDKMNAHAINKYIPLVVSTVREGWPALLGVFLLAFILSLTYLMIVECLAFLVVWASLICMFIIPGAAGTSLIYSKYHGGMDGIPGSADGDTDLVLGVGLCVLSAFFLCVMLCMTRAINRAIRVVEAAAACLFDCKTLLLEPIINLCVRMTYWTVMTYGFICLISVGEVRKSKIYRTFTYSTEESIFIAFYVFFWIWGNDFITACSQYAIANASARWYFTEHSNGSKSGLYCLLCTGYCNVCFHLGSLAFGSCIIAFCRPIRLVMLVLLSAGEVTDNAFCGCLSGACACCLGCFDRCLAHMTKNAFIDMAITSKPFCAAGGDAAWYLSPENGAGGKAFWATMGSTWIFSVSGLGAVTAAGAFITAFLAEHLEVFSRPSSRHYIQDPMVFTFLAGWICFGVSLCFMLVFDSVTDALFLAMAMDYYEAHINPVPVYKPEKIEKKNENMFTSMFSCESVREVRAPKAIERPQFGHPNLKNFFEEHKKGLE